MTTCYPMHLSPTLFLILTTGCQRTGNVVDDVSAIQALDCDACGGDCRYEHVTQKEARHVDGGVDYHDRPPVGGNHDPCWGEWGEHQTALEDEHWVHNLEHGGVVFLYDCPGGCEEERIVLASFVEEHWGRALVTPYTDMGGTFAAVAWGYRLVTDCLELDAIQSFYDDHVDQAPESSQSLPPSGCMEDSGSADSGD